MNPPARRRSVGRVGRGIALAALVALASLGAQAEDKGLVESSLPRHALEDKALNEPEQVLKQLPDQIKRARDSGNSRELALLLLAQANACRVIADWPCQRVAGASAVTASQAANDPILKVRSLIAESRATMAMQDFTRSEKLLGEAELVLKGSPSPELSADVNLAYSSLSHSLGKHALSAEYAQRGLDVLVGDLALPTQARLLRNLARAQAQLGLASKSDETQVRAQVLTERFDDPKLSAEILLGSARTARVAGNIEAQVRTGQRVLQLGSRLKNSQVTGMGHEVLGLAAFDAGDRSLAIRELNAAYRSFRNLGLKRDESRVLRELIRIAIAQGRPRAEVEGFTARFLEIDSEIEQSDRAKAADDFDARLAYAERELDVLRLKDEAALALERERTLAASNRQSRVLGWLAAATLLVVAAFYLVQRRSNQRMKATLALLRESEARAHDLLNLSAGFVFLHDVEGRLLLVNPAAAQALGQPSNALVGRLLQDFQPRAGREPFADYLERMQSKGEDQGVFLVRSGEGDHRHWRYSSRLSEPEDGRAYVVGNAVDVTDQVHHTRALHEQSVRDALTGTYNRRHLEIFETSHPVAASWAAVTVDLDHFKQINDSQGHDRGDQVLIDFAQFLSDRVRGDDAVVRLGGDEFLVLLAQADNETLRATAGRLQLDSAAAPCAFSVGSALREDRESLAATIARADASMYAARAAARAPRVQETARAGPA